MNMKNPIRVFIVLLSLQLIIIPSAMTFAAENRMEIVTDKSMDSPGGKFLNLIYTEAFRRLGITFVYGQYPAKRCSLLSDSGKVDGELSRIYSYNEIHPNVIRVEEPHWTSGFIAVAAAPSLNLDGWESLKHTDYMVNYRRGIKGCETNLPKVVIPANLERVNSVTQGYKKLLRGRSDLFVGAELNIMSVLGADEFKHSKLRIAGVMEQFTAHVFLHKKHKALVPRLESVLRDIKREGLYEKYRENANLIVYFK